MMWGCEMQSGRRARWCVAADECWWARWPETHPRPWRRRRRRPRGLRWCDAESSACSCNFRTTRMAKSPLVPPVRTWLVQRRFRLVLHTSQTPLMVASISMGAAHDVHRVEGDDGGGVDGMACCAMASLVIDKWGACSSVACNRLRQSRRSDSSRQNVSDGACTTEFSCQTVFHESGVVSKALYWVGTQSTQ